MEKLPSSIEISKQLYLQIVNGEEVLEFQKYLNGDIEDKNLTKRYKIAFDMVKNDLMSRCKDGKFPKTSCMAIKKFFYQQKTKERKIRQKEYERFKSNNIRKKQSSLNQAPYSSCRPHMRMVGKYIYYHDGSIKNIETQETTKNFFLNDNGYAVYNGKLVHRLMAEAWLINPDPEIFTQVNHKNKNRSDNSIENLEWVDPNGNIQHKLGREYFPAPRYYTRGD